MVLCSGNTVRVSSHWSFFCGGYHFYEVVRWPENPDELLIGLFEWPAGLSLCLRDQQSSPLRLSDHWISSFSPNLQTLYCLFKSHAEVWTSSLPRIFYVYGWLSELTYYFLFSVICWSYLRTEISVILSKAINYILAITVYISLSCENHFVDVILRPHWIY